ncbi:P-loop containing nucleoside triphosphate hydrolase protein [Xylaria arbuscula]|nr:P-loop containing nucleoside triphosphate hydrolase protein [Xylaria arbuscula]
MATVSLDPEAIEQLGGERKALLDAIDDLRKHGIGRFVDLPQIIVVGDQSSGKSSVLEAISRVRFPAKAEVCTRFPTELVLRTDPQVKIHVQTQPASASPDTAFTFEQTTFDKDDLPRIIEKAKTHLLRNGANFSEDVLRVEICSPDVPHLTLVDLPGFYHSWDENQSADGREIVDRLVRSYMKKKNSIILAIVSARNQVVMQKVLAEVKNNDNNQERTLGVITKPDLLLPDSEDEHTFMKLARNQEPSHQLALGWHVLRNRSETEAALKPDERDANEKEFFDSGIWSAISSNNRGVLTLRKKLANILLDHIRKNLDTLIKDIQENMKIRKEILERLGAPRSSTSQLRAYLDKMASQFQLLSRRAIEGNYSDEFFGSLYHDTSSVSIDDPRVRKLRAFVRDLNRTFSYVLATRGSRRIIVPDQLDDEESNEESILDNNENEELSLPSFLSDLETLYPFNNPEEVTRNTISAELEPISSANQGTEFPGTTNDLLAVKLFQDQSRPWEAIARLHIDITLRVAKSFAEKLLIYITGPDQQTCSAILSNIVDPFFEKRTSKLESKLQELLYHFQSGYPQPSDAEFRAALARRRQKHLNAEFLRNLLASHSELFTRDGKRQLASSISSAKQSKFGVESLIDKSETYYELSLRNFTENVIILAIENCLIKDLPTILTTSAVSQMENDMLERLAAESADIQIERTELAAECEALQKGLDLCKTYRGRNLTVFPAVPIHSRDNSPMTSRDAQVVASPSSSSSSAISAPSKTPNSGIIGTAIAQSSAFPSGGPLTSTNVTNNKNSAPVSGIFGSTSATITQNTAGGPSSFASVPKSTSNIFGNPASIITNPAPKSSLFGNLTNTPSSFGSPSGTNIFGNSMRATSNPASSLLSKPTSTTANGSTTSGLFGKPMSTTASETITTWPNQSGNGTSRAGSRASGGVSTSTPRPQ